MKKLFTIVCILLCVFMAGCGTDRKEESAAPEKGDPDAITIRVLIHTDDSITGMAVNSIIDCETAGSKAQEHGSDPMNPVKTDKFEFRFRREELPEGTIGTLRTDLYACEEAGKDYTACGGAEIKDPSFGQIYTLVLQGSFTDGFVLSVEEGQSGIQVVPAAGQ